jgi:hypothetical protein
MRTRDHHSYQPFVLRGLERHRHRASTPHAQNNFARSVSLDQLELFESPANDHNPLAADDAEFDDYTADDYSRTDYGDACVWLEEDDDLERYTQEPEAQRLVHGSTLDDIAERTLTALLNREGRLKK